MACGAQSGKTIAAAFAFLRQIFIDYHQARKRLGELNQPYLNYWVVAPTYKLLEIPFRYIRQLLPPAIIKKDYKSEYKIVLLNGIIIEGRSADNPQTLVSATLNGCWEDEAARIDSEAHYGGISQRIGANNGWLILSSTPLGRNWFYEEYQRGLVNSPTHNPTYQSFHWTTEDNPFFSKAYLNNEKDRLPKEYYEREYLASFDSFAGLIFPELSDKHIVSEQQLKSILQLPAHIKLADICQDVRAGVDWGWQDESTICIVGKYKNNFIVLDEFYAKEMYFTNNNNPNDPNTLYSHIWNNRRKWRIGTYICDHRPEYINYLNDCGINAISAEKGKDSIFNGVMKIKELLKVPNSGQPRLYVMNHCANLIKEMRNYLWADNPIGNQIDVPAKGQADHLIDALRYVIRDFTRDEFIPSPNPVINRYPLR